MHEGNRANTRDHADIQVDRRKLIQAFAAGAAGLAVAAEFADSGLAQDAEVSTVRLAQGVDIRSFDPHEDTTSAAIAIFRNVFDNLVRRDADMALVPALAESWTNPDDLTWEFKIRQGVTFHNGVALTANDVKFTIDHVLDPDVGSRQYSNVSMIQGAEVVDDFTLRITTAEPVATLVAVLQYLYILPAQTYQEMGAEAFSLAPVGSGPYKFVEWVRDDHVRIEANPDYWGGVAPIQVAEFRPIPEAATRVASLKAGELDVATLIPVIDAPSIEEDENLDIRTVQSLRIIFAGMNCFEAPFTDVRVRQALNHAVDVQAIIDNLLNGYGVRTASVTGPSEFGFNPDIQPYAYDPDLARQLLAEAGYPDGFSTTLDTPIGRYLQDVEVSQAIAGMLAEVGVQVEVRQAEFNEYFDRWLAKEIKGLYFLGNGGSLMDADAVMGGHFDSQRRAPYFNTPEGDEMIHAAARELDPTQRLAIYQDLMVYLHDQAPWVFLYVQEDIYGVSSDLNWTPKPDESLRLPEMSFGAGE